MQFQLFWDLSFKMLQVFNLHIDIKLFKLRFLFLVWFLSEIFLVKYIEFISFLNKFLLKGIHITMDPLHMVDFQL